MRVIKLGGSLLETGKMLACLNHILNIEEKTVVVCGGGDFANQIRVVQKKWQFDDVAAHEMAILAMKQTAIMLQNLQPKFIHESTVSNLTNHQFSIWSPNMTELNTAKIPPSWEITSDSLAAWLATKLDAKKLIIVKSCNVDLSLNLKELTIKGIVDEAFSNFTNNAKFHLNITSADIFLNS